MKKALNVLLIVILVLAVMAGCFLCGMWWTQMGLHSEVSTASVEQKMDEIGTLLDTYYIDDYSPLELEVAAGDGAAAAMIAATGDRWSYYIPASEMAQYTESFYNSYVGIGVTIQEVEQGEKIVSVTPGGPAEEAGVLAGDILIAVEGQSVLELGNEGTKNLVRGQEGSFVSLEFLRGGESYTCDVERRAIVTPVAEYELLEGNIAYLRIYNFDHHCAEQTIACLEQALADGAEALLFDVRFNGGGLKDEMVRVLDYLLPEGELFRSVDYAGEEDVDYSDEDHVDLPMAVLVNEDSYSAAEFFAAALQEYGVGQVIGVQTSGKGNFQYTFDLSDGSAVAISSGHYVTPSGKSLTDVGITPDVVMDLNLEDYEALFYGTLEKADDEQLQAALQTLTEKVS